MMMTVVHVAPVAIMAEATKRLKEIMMGEKWKMCLVSSSAREKLRLWWKKWLYLHLHGETLWATKVPLCHLKSTDIESQLVWSQIHQEKVYWGVINEI